MRIKSSYLTCHKALTRWCVRNEFKDWVAIDTEFERRNTFYPIPSLIQLATDDSICCIDAVLIKSLEPLTDFLSNPRRTLTFHAGRQDIEVLIPLGLNQSATIFDTQLAASLCGLRDQIGYAQLVYNLLNLKIDKSNQRTNWLKRPLAKTQLDYAAEDVRYLFSISEILKNKLTNLGRLEWFFEECRLSSFNWFNDSPNNAWKRLKNIHSLPRSLALKACYVAVWREFLAMEINIPRNWILSDKHIKQLVTTSIQSKFELNSIFEKSERIRAEDLESLYKILRGDKTYPAVSYSPPARLDTEQKKTIEAAVEGIRVLAKKNCLEPSLLATSRELKELMLTKSSSRLLTNWRRQLLKDIYEEFEL